MLVGGPRGVSACQQMLWSCSSGTGHLHTRQSLDLASGSRKTPQRTGISQKWDGSEVQMKECATSKGSSIV